VIVLLSHSEYKPQNMCLKGFKIRVKRRTLNKQRFLDDDDEATKAKKKEAAKVKDRTSLLRHARFLKNLKVVPDFPDPPTVDPN